MSKSAKKSLSIGFGVLALSLPLTAAEDVGPSAGAAAQATSAAGPKNNATKTITNFSQALRCMDELFVAHGKQGIVITSAGIPDATGKVSTGTKEMLISAIAKMTIKSNAFEFIDYHSASDDLGQLFAKVDQVGASRQKVPDYYIRGSITQLDDNAVRQTKGAGISLPFLDLGHSKEQSYDVISMDMSVGETATRKIIPVTSTANTMVIVKAGKSTEAGGKLGSIGLSFNLDNSKSGGLGATTRTLLELGVIETLGKFTQVPYWRCLDADITNPHIRDLAMEGYDMMKNSERVLFVQRKLGGSMNRYKGPVDGAMNPTLKDSIMEYQAAVGLVANGVLDFDLYASLIDDAQNSLAALPTTPAPPPPVTASAVPMPPPAAPPMPTAVSAAPAQAAQAALPVAPVVRLSLESDKGARPTYKVGEILNMSLSLSSDGTAYCYYEDSSRATARIFPNQFQPNPTLRANSKVRVPSAGFKIKFDRPGTERVACIGADRELVVPQGLIGVRDLTPMSVRSVDDVVGRFRQSNPAALVSQIDITVNR
jgi:curli biogenesis system outer membrane secretion channel CsgG